MKKVSLNFLLKNLDGTDIAEANAGHVIANQLAAAMKSVDPIKFWTWAVCLRKDEILNIDKSDARLLRDFVEKNENLSVLTKAQVMEAIDNPKE